MICEDDVESIRGWASRIKDKDHIVFTVPKSAHYGYSNYLMLVLHSIINNNSNSNNNSMSVICEGDGLFPFSASLNTIM